MIFGECVGLFEVESKFVEYLVIVEVGVIGKLDLVWGEIIKVFIVFREGYELFDQLKEDICFFVK